MAKLLKENLEKAQNRMKMYADKMRIEREFNEGDWMFLKLPPYRHTSIAMRKSLCYDPNPGLTVTDISSPLWAGENPLSLTSRAYKYIQWKSTNIVMRINNSNDNFKYPNKQTTYTCPQKPLKPEIPTKSGHAPDNDQKGSKENIKIVMKLVK